MPLMFVLLIFVEFTNVALFNHRPKQIVPYELNKNQQYIKYMTINIIVQVNMIFY